MNKEILFLCSECGIIETEIDTQKAEVYADIICPKCKKTYTTTKWLENNQTFMVQDKYLYIAKKILLR